MRMVRTVGLGALLAFASSAALAFQEQQGAPAASQPSAREQGAAKDLNLSTDVPASKQGAEVRIPGLGRLGVLPKMDFGLELLYGAAEPRAGEPPATSPADEELTIRGSLKHRF